MPALPGGGGANKGNSPLFAPPKLPTIPSLILYNRDNRYYFIKIYIILPTSLF